MNGQATHFYTFGPFVLDAAQHLLLREGRPVPIAPKAIDTLLLLVCNAGRLIEKDDLMKELWPNAFVEEGNLTKNIFVLRKALGNGDLGREYIETVPKRGYRFVATVTDSDRTEIIPAPLSAVAVSPAFDGSATPVPHSEPVANVGLPSRTAVGTPPLQVAPWRWAAPLVAVALVALAGWFWFSAAPQPTVLKVAQLTHFGRVEPTSRLVTDGTRIYFEESRGGRTTLAAVPVEGGEPVRCPHPSPKSISTASPPTILSF